MLGPKSSSNAARICLVIISSMIFVTSCKENLPTGGQLVDTSPPIHEVTDAQSRIDPTFIDSDQNSSILPPASLTPKATKTTQPFPTETSTPEIAPTATPIGPCQLRIPKDDLLTLVTLEYDISRDYIPPGLVNLSDHFPISVTMGYPTQIRDIVVEPLAGMIGDMLEDGLKPQIVSGYRSYAAQAIAWSRWQDEYPDRAIIVSAPPGHSEHQLGTTIDFGSPELAEIVGDDDIRFHTYFYKTGEGQWLNENAHKYGFTLSYTRENSEIAGLYYEPWHFRYIGVELASYLKENDISLIKYLLENQELPCIPDSS